MATTAPVRSGALSPVPGQAPPESASTPERSPPGGTAFHAAGRALKGYFTDQRRLTRVAISAATSLPFVFLMVYYTRGALLYRIDWVGVYSVQGFLRTPIPDAILPAVGSALSLGNLTAANYIALFLDAFFCTYGAQLLARELFRKTFSDRWLIGVQAIAAAGYLVNPYNVTWSVYALTLELFLSQAAFLIVMMEVVRLVRCAQDGRRFSGWDGALLGLAIGLSMPASLPNDARVLAFEFAGLLLAGIALLIFARIPRRRPAIRQVVRTFLLYSAPLGILLVLPPIYAAWTAGFFSTSDIAAITKVITAVAKEYTPIKFTVRLLGRPELFAAPYLKFYTKIPITVVASYSWPVLALAVPIPAAFLLRLRDKVWICSAVLLAIPCVIWGAGANPPFGAAYDFITTHLPFGASLFPPFYPIQLLATKLYCVLVAFSVAMVYYGVRRALVGRKRPSLEGVPASAKRQIRWRRFRRSRIPAYVATGVVVGLVFLAAVPMYTGGIFYGVTGSGKGYFIPGPYFQVRSILQGLHGNAVLLPPLPTYFDTVWGYHGATAFYSAFFYPSQIIVPAYYGPYQTDFGAASQEYNLATHPIGPGPNSTLVPLQKRGWTVDGDLPHTTTFSYQPYPSFSLSNDNVSAPLTWLTMTLPTANASSASALAALLQASEATANITTSATNSTTGVVKFHSGIFEFEPGRYNSIVTAVGPRSVNVTLLIWNPSVVYPVGGYQAAGDVAYVNITLDEPGLAGTIDGPPIFSVGSDSVVQPGWTSLMQSYNVKYLLWDNSTQDGIELRPVVINTLIELQDLGAITPVYLSGGLELWQISS